MDIKRVIKISSVGLCFFLPRLLKELHRCEEKVLKVEQGEQK